MRHPFRTSASQAPDPRRAWTLTTLLAAAFLLAPGVLAGVKPEAPTLLDDAPDPMGLSERFHDYELQAMDPYLYRAQLETGAIDVVLRGKAYHLLVERAPGPEEWRVGEMGPDGEVRYTEMDFDPVVYTGTVAGLPSSNAVVAVSASGVLGEVWTEGEYVLFEPLRFIRDDAPAGISVVFHAKDAIGPAFAHDHPDPEVASLVPPPSTEEPGIHAYAPGPNRRIALMADQSLISKLPNSWRDRFIQEFHVMNVQWTRMLGFGFNTIESTVFVCDLCNSADKTELLAQLTQQLNQAGTMWSTYEVGFLYTGTDVVGAAGAAWQPGRFAFIEGDHSDSTWRQKAIAHELGHAFGAWHSRGEVYLHQHPDGSSATHNTIMRGTDARPLESMWEFSTINRNWIRACNLLTWSGGSRLPVDQASFGNRCWLPSETVENGGVSGAYTFTNHIGKFFENVPPGDVGNICAYMPAGGSLRLGVKPVPDGSAPLFTVDVPGNAQGWNCAHAPAEYYWRWNTLFVYKVSGTGAVSYDASSPYDSRVSYNGGATWHADPTRLGFKVSFYSGRFLQDPCGALGPGTTLAEGQGLSSCDGAYRLVHQTDGNVVLYQNGRVHWASHTAGRDATALVMQADGNLVLYSYGVAVWASNTAGNPGAWLSVRNDGTMMIYAKSGKTIWYAGCGLLALDARIVRGGELRSCDNRFNLAHQFDGNVVLYQNGFPLWATGTNGRATTELRMQSDGNLVLYNYDTPVWASNTASNPDSRLRVQDDGRIVIYTNYDVDIWRRPDPNA